jgi:hypothetical protein
MWEAFRPFGKTMAIDPGQTGPKPQPEAAADGRRAEKPLPPAAERALREAAERRAAIDARAEEIARRKEHHGRGGLDPVRYDDWEVKGLASDF